MSVYPRLNGFEVCVTLPSGRRIRRQARSFKEGELLELKIRNELLGPVSVFEIQHVKFSELMERVKDDWLNERKVRSYQSFFHSYCQSIDRFFGQMELRNITSTEVKAFKRWRESEVKPGTVGNSLKVLRRIFNFAIQEKLVAVNPVKGIKIPKSLPRVRFLSVQEQNALLAAITDQDFKDLVWCAMRTGLRRGNLMNLRLCDVDFGRSQVTLPETKSGKPLTVRVLPQVRELLERRAIGLSPQDFLLCNRKNKWGIIRRRWMTLCRRVTLPGLRFHDLRHTFASDMLAAGVPLESLRVFLGHASITTTQIYAHLAVEFQARDLERLGEHLERCGAVAPHS